MPDEQFLFVVWVRGGPPFALSSKANPPLDHDGRDSVVSMVLSLAEVQNIKVFVEGQGCTISFERQAQTKSQESERMRLLGVGQEGTVWLSRLCPECAWFDPLSEIPCGKRSWDPSTVEAFMGFDKANQDWEKCDAKDR